MRVKVELPSVGERFEAPYPFVRDKYSRWDEDGTSEHDTWKPGTRGEQTKIDDYEWFADAMGSIILTVVGTFKPAGYAARVFFTRRWRNPDGVEFGKGKLHITAISNFRALARGYRREFAMAEESTP